MSTLLEKAKKVASPRSPDCGRKSQNRDEMLELAIAFANHEITSTQVASAIGCAAGGVYSSLAQALMYAVRHRRYRLEKL